MNLIENGKACLRIKMPITINAEFLAQLSIILFFASDFIRALTNKFFGVGNFSTLLVMFVIYTPLIFACVLKPKKYIKVDFIVLLSIILLFFLCTYLAYPQYAYYYSSSDYGIWNHVLIPYRGIYAYLFIRLLDDPEKIKRSLKISGWLMVLFFLYTFYASMRRGYWYGVVGSNAEAEMSYSVSFGYSVLPVALLFLYSAIKEKKKTDMIAAVITILLMVMGGSRGAVLFLSVFLALYLLIKLKYSRHKVAIIVGIIVCIVALYLSYNYILVFLTTILSQLGINSRFLTKLLDGTIASDSGRYRIWMAAIQMIREKPLGYGAMGSRFKIVDYIIAGYPHSIVLEILIDFGVIIGGVILLVIIYNSMRMLFFNKSGDWKGLFLIYFSAACSLFVSLTYWSVPTIWTCIGLVVNSRMSEKKKGVSVYFNSGIEIHRTIGEVKLRSKGRTWLYYE